MIAAYPALQQFFCIPAGYILCTRSTDTTGRAIFSHACAALPGDILNRCAQLISEGKLAARLSVSLPLEEAARAHGLIESGHVQGKIVLTK